MRRLALVATTALFAAAIACSPGSGNSPGGTINQPPQTGLVTEALEECPTAQSCDVDAPHNYVSDSTSVQAQLRSMVAVGCQRFHGDCNYLCDNIFYECGPSAAKCTEDATKDYLEDYDYPVIDAKLVQDCIADIQGAACTDIPPNTPACDHVMLEGCPQDQDNLGAPYSFLSAARVTATESTFTVNLCQFVDEWLVVALEQGETLVVHEAQDEPAFGSVTAALNWVPPGRDEPEQLDSSFINWGAEEPRQFGPVDNDADYFVRLTGFETMNFALSVTITPAAAP